MTLMVIQEHRYLIYLVIGNGECAVAKTFTAECKNGQDQLKFEWCFLAGSLCLICKHSLKVKDTEYCIENQWSNFKNTKQTWKRQVKFWNSKWNRGKGRKKKKRSFQPGACLLDYTVIVYFRI